MFVLKKQLLETLKLHMCLVFVAHLTFLLGSGTLDTWMKDDNRKRNAFLSCITVWGIPPQVVFGKVKG